MKTTLIFLALSLALPAQAAPIVSPVMARQKFAAAGALCAAGTASCKVLNAVAATASAAVRTFTLPVAGFSKTTIQLDFVRTAGTAVTLTCSASLNGGASYASVTSTSVTAGAGTVTPYVDTWTTSATGNVLFEYDTRTDDSLQCVVAVTTGGANDTVTVYATGAVGQ